MSRFKPLLFSVVGSAALLAAAPLWADPAKTDAPQAAQTAAPTAKPAASPDSTMKVQYDQAMQRRANDRKAFMDARMAALRAGLELTPAQDPLWSPVEAALRDLGKARHEMRMGMWRHDDKTASDPADRLKQRGERLVAMGQAIGKLADAAGPLAKSLSPEQKQRLPELLHHVGPRHLLKLAFGMSGDGGRMRSGDGGWHHRRFAERDGDGRDFGGRGGHGFEGHDMDRPHFGDSDRGGWHRQRDGWDREGRADDRGDGRGFDRDGDSFGHRDHRGNGDDERG